MKHIIMIGLLIAALLSACSAVPAPSPTMTMSAETPTAQATATAAPTQTATALPTGTFTPTATAKLTNTPKLTKTPKPKVFIGCFTPNGMNGPTAPFKIENHTNKKVVVYINGVSRNGNHPIYCTETVKQGIPEFLTLMWGDYTYIVEIGNRTTKRGEFFINDSDKATMQVFDNKIRIGPFP